MSENLDYKFLNKIIDDLKKCNIATLIEPNCILNITISEKEFKKIRRELNEEKM